MHVARCGDIQLRINPHLPPGLVQVTLSGCPHRQTSLAGLAIAHRDDIDGVAEEDDFSQLAADHALYAAPNPARELQIVGVDHVVVLADDVRATCAEIERLSGAPLKRVKEGQRGTQGFHRWGSVILEVVERRLVHPKPSDAGSNPPGSPGSPSASYWGFVVVVDDIDATTAWLGPDVIGAPKMAVQTGRRIATVRSAAGLGVPLAFMSRE